MNLAWKSLLPAVLLLAGCATYTTPGAGVNMDSLSLADPEIADAFDAEPAARFPARIALARVQASGYSARGTACYYGGGTFCVVTARDIESEASYTRLARLPQVVGLAPMNRLMLPAHLKSTRDLRQAAAGLKADLLLIYTVDTVFNMDNTDVGPLAMITLGFLPTKKAQVTATASAVMLDVRSGFVYGVAEASALEEQRGTFWSQTDAIDGARKTAERQAFEKLVGEIATFWSDLLKTHAGEQPPANGEQPPVKGGRPTIVSDAAQRGR
jgi:hypothetical protein